MNGKKNITRELKELTLLFEISRLLDQKLDLRDVLYPVMAAVSENMGMMRGSVTLLNRKTGEITIEAAFGLSEREKNRGKYKPGEGVTGKVVQEGKPLVVPKVADDPRFLDRTGARRNKDMDISFICVPIKLENEVVGTIAAGLFGAEKVLGISESNTGLFYGGGFHQFGVQILGVAVAFLWAFGTGLIMFLLIKRTAGLRVTREEELRGLDIGEHGMEAYGGFQIFTTQ